MPKVKLTISIDEEVAKDLRARSIEKYGNSRSFSQLIEDLATDSAESATVAGQSCSLKRTMGAITCQDEFNTAADDLSQRFEALKIEVTAPNPEAGRVRPPPAEEFYVVKEVMERRLNKLANIVNDCPGCHGLDEPLTTYPDAGHNFEQLYLIGRIHQTI